MPISAPLRACNTYFAGSSGVYIDDYEVFVIKKI